MLTLDKAKVNIRKEVIYSGGYPEIQKGFIKSINEKYIFVAFWDDLQKNGIACDPINITLLSDWEKRKRWRDILND